MKQRDPETEVLGVCRELGIRFVPYSPLGRRFLTGKIKKREDLPEDDYRHTTPRFQGENFQRNLDLVERVGEIAVTPLSAAAPLHWPTSSAQFHLADLSSPSAGE